MPCPGSSTCVAATPAGLRTRTLLSDTCRDISTVYFCSYDGLLTLDLMQESRPLHPLEQELWLLVRRPPWLQLQLPPRYCSARVEQEAVQAYQVREPPDPKL